VTKELRLVRWIDSGMHIDHGWAPSSTYLDGAEVSRMEVTSVGIVMHEDDDIVVLALSHDPAHDKWISAQLIHRPSIVEMQRLVAA
jgi:hypothetical protein